jgi:hypothetical protein
MDGDAGLEGWRWIFIIVRTPYTNSPLLVCANRFQEGIATCFCGIAAYFFLVDLPERGECNHSLIGCR